MRARTLAWTLNRLALAGLLTATACASTKDTVQPNADGGGDGDSVHQSLTLKNPDPQPPVDPHASTVPTAPRPVVLMGAPAAGSATATRIAKQWVKGDEVFQLVGAMVRVDRVVYVHNPCPPGVQCITSGIIHNVHVTVTRGDVTEAAIVGEVKDKGVNGVQVHVGEVRPGPTAEVMFDLPGSDGR